MLEIKAEAKRRCNKKSKGGSEAESSTAEENA